MSYGQSYIIQIECAARELKHGSLKKLSSIDLRISAARPRNRVKPEARMHCVHFPQGTANINATVKKKHYLKIQTQISHLFFMLWYEIAHQMPDRVR